MKSLLTAAIAITLWAGGAVAAQEADAGGHLFQLKVGQETAPFYNYPIVKGIHAARYASVGISHNANWEPKKPEDIPVPWPQSWIDRYGQAFNPHSFAQNAGVIRGNTEKFGWKPIYAEVIQYMDDLARQYTKELPGGNLQVFYDFEKRNYDMVWPRGWGGAFGTTKTAIGYMHFYKATGNEQYLRRAERLLDGALNPGAKDRGWSIDSKGYFWLEEIASGDLNLGVYNGHIYAIIAYYTYKDLTGSNKYDAVIRAATTTMAHWLPLQRRPEGFFGYDRDHLHQKDYGQERAVILAEFLCRMTTDPALCGTAEAFRQSFEAWTETKGG